MSFPSFAAVRCYAVLVAALAGSGCLGDGSKTAAPTYTWSVAEYAPEGAALPRIESDAPWAVGATVDARLLAASCSRVAGQECDATVARSVVATNPAVWRLEYDWMMSSQLLVAIAPGTGGVTAVGPDAVGAPLALEAVAPVALWVTTIASGPSSKDPNSAAVVHLAAGRSTSVLVSVLGDSGETLRGSFPMTWTTTGQVTVAPAETNPGGRANGAMRVTAGEKPGTASVVFEAAGMSVTRIIVVDSAIDAAE